MANIALITDSTGDPAFTNVRSILLNGGHTCSSFTEADAPSLIAFDLILATRINQGTNKFPNIIAAFNTGVPVICGFHRFAGTGFGPSSSTLAGQINLSSMVSEYSEVNTYTSTTSDMGIKYPIGTTVKIHSSAQYTNYVLKSTLATGAVTYFSHPSDPSNRSGVVIAAKGSNNLQNAPFPASCAFISFLYSNSEYLQAGKELLLDIVDKVLALNISATHTISGYVLDENDTPLANRVMLYNQDTSALEDTAIPDADGKYSFKVVKDTDFFVVCSSASSDKNYQVYAYVQGVLV